MTFISGAFSATFNGKALGTTEDGFEETTTRIYEEIRADHYQGMLDGVVRGIDMMIRTVLYEVNMPGVRDLIWPYDADNDGTLFEATEYGKVGGMGQLLSTYAKPLVLTPCGGTSAALVGGPTAGAVASITYPRAVIAAEATSIRFNAGHRKLPVTILILPSPDTAPTAPAAVTICSSPMSYFVVA